MYIVLLLNLCILAILVANCGLSRTVQCTEVRFASLLSDGFTAMAVIINPPERKLAKRTSVQWSLAGCTQMQTFEI